MNHLDEMKKLRMICEDEDPTESDTDCRDEIGITVGLIDGIIAAARILAKRDWDSFEVKEALKDIRSDEDVAKILDREME